MCYVSELHECVTRVHYLNAQMSVHAQTQVKWGGTHRMHDTAQVEAKHRISLKSHGRKVHVRSDTQVEKDLLRINQV